MKPMLACSTLPDLEKIKYPKYASTKLDGIRCLIIDSKAMSRSLKPIPNLFVQSELAGLGLDGCDGELMISGDFNDVQSAIMSVHGEPDFSYKVFDYVDENLSFDRRLDIAIRNLYGKSSRVSILEQYRVHNAAQVNELYDTAIADGHEGLILKDINGKYKYGRSTLNQELMLKLKEVIDTEGVVIGTAELMLNENEALTDALNNQVRSNHQANKVRGGVLGSLVVRFGEHVVNVGSGFSYGQRILYWQDKSSLIGRVVTFKHLGLSKYGVPRCPIFKGFRED